MSQNPQLHQAARDWTTTCLLAMATKCPTPDVEPETRWIRNGDALVQTVVLRTDWFRCFLSLEPQFGTIPEYTTFLEALRADPLVAAQLDTLVGSYASGATRLEATSLPRSFVLQMTRETGHLTFDPDVFERIYGNLESFLYSQTFVHVSVAPLYGFDSDTERWDLGGGLQLKRLSDSEVSRAIEVGVVASPFGLGGRVFFHPPRFGVVIEREDEKTIGEWSDPPPTTNAPNPDDAIEDVVEALRLFKKGVVGAHGLIAFGGSLFGAGGVTFRSYGASSHFIAGPTYRLDDAEKDEFYSFWTSLKSKHVRDSKGVQMAIRRLSYAAERRRSEDQIVDLMIAAEALFLEGRDDPMRSEQRYRLSLRAAVFTPTSQLSRREVFRLFRSAYDARSTIAHGGTIERVSLPDKADATLPELNSEIDEHLRQAIRAAVAHCESTKRPFSFDWETAILGS